MDAVAPDAVSGDLVDRPAAASQLLGLVFALVLLDPEGRVVEMNPAAEDLLGRSARRLNGMFFSQMVQFGDERLRAGLAQPDQPLVARNVAVIVGPVSRRVDLTISPLSLHPGWRVVTLSDASRHADDDDEGLVRAPVVLAHEIKNPLAGIRGAGQLLARRLDPRDRPLADIIATEVDRIAALIDRMQQLGSAPRVAMGHCNPHEAIRNAVATVRVARADSITFAEEFDPSLPTVAADGAMLEHVLINLLANACDACEGMPDARIKVCTRYVGGLVFNAIRFGQPTRLPVEIIVTDNGPGIEPTLRDHVFEPFVSSKPQGQGLGLALVRKLIRDMGGRISHDRDEKAGLTSFRINLAVAPKSVTAQRERDQAQ